MVENYSDKLCLVLNLWYLSQFLYTPHFKYEDLRVDALLFERHEFLFKLDFKVCIEPEWIPREQNQLADYCSRVIDHDNWMLNTEVLGG